MFEHRPFGNSLKLSLAGASHAPSLRFKLEGLPPGFAVDEVALSRFMERRAPGRDALSTPRREQDAVEFISREPLEGVIRNVNCRPQDYGAKRTIPRPGHADFGQWIEYGAIPSGGGSNSGRMTAALCAAGGACLQYLERRGIKLSAKLESVHGNSENPKSEILAAKAQGDSVGGVVVCEAVGFPAGLGGALFAGIETELAGALFAIPGVKGVEFGNGFAAAGLKGTENNDAFVVENGVVATESNSHGGILGGRSSGMPISARVAFKPTPTVFKPQSSVDLTAMRPADCAVSGRHDPCIVLRALPVVEAVTAFALADILLTAERSTPRICLTLTGPTLAENLAQLRSQHYFTDMVELRVDLLARSEREGVARFLSGLDRSAVVTFRRKRDGGAFEGEEAERVDFFRSLLASPPALCGTLYVDFEDDFRHEELKRLAASAGAVIIRSLHDFSGPVGDIDARIEQLRGGTDEIPKIAFMPESPLDVASLFGASARRRRPCIICAMGVMGQSSRALAQRTGSMLTYASVSGLEGIGHFSPHELVKTYRIRAIDENAALFGVTGWPLETTRSPELHNAAFAAADIDALMVSVPSPTAAEAVEFMKRTGMKGMAVTIPHKRAVMPLLDRIDGDALAVGAVNTVALEDGKYVGYNTDVAGFAEAFAAFAGAADGRRVAVLGDGGAAQAVKAALARLGFQFEVFHRRTPLPGFELFVNATPADPIPDYAFTGREAVYDLRYAPEETELMQRARAAGCRVENGLSMLSAQAREQRRIWGMA